MEPFRIVGMLSSSQRERQGGVAPSTTEVEYGSFFAEFVL